VTPGTVVEPGLLDSKSNNYLVSVVGGEGEAGIAFVDITTSEFAVTQLPLARAKTELERLNPSEVIAAEGAEIESLGVKDNITRLDSYRFDLEIARQALLDHFGVTTLEGYGCAHLPLAIRAAGAIIHYIGETQKSVLGQLTHLTTYSTESYMALDTQTQRNLEIFQGARSGGTEGSLLSVIDATKTPMGGRLLRKWLGQPLLDPAALNLRLDAIAWFIENSLPRRQIVGMLKDVADLERLINRVRGEIAIPREMVTLKHSLEAVPKLTELLCQPDPELAEGEGSRGGDDSIVSLTKELKPCREAIELIAKAIEDEPSSAPGEGGVIKPGFSEELDSLREISGSAKKYLANLELKERERTGIKSLKVGFNNIFGYYIEVSNANLNQVPQDCIRKQKIGRAHV
jgi:DNA mismatch repair protein MutS